MANLPQVELTDAVKSQVGFDDHLNALAAKKNSSKSKRSRSTPPGNRDILSFCHVTKKAK
jgi:hypothetical protein